MYAREKRLHHLLWDWIASNPSRTKDEWKGWKKNSGLIHGVKNHCFACEVAMRLSYDKLNCAFCPINWGEFKPCCDPSSIWTEYYNLQRDYNNSHNGERIAYLATIIRNIPWKGRDEMRKIAKRLNYV